MEWNKNKLECIVNFINGELNSGKPMVRIEKDMFGENERVIHKRLIRLGYKKINNQYILKDNITYNITNDISYNTINKKNANDKKDNDEDKLKVLLDNLDDLLELINKKSNTCNITNIRSGVSDVKSFRIDTGIYEEVKRVAHIRELNIGEIINKALEEYLTNISNIK